MEIVQDQRKRKDIILDALHDELTTTKEKERKSHFRLSIHLMHQSKCSQYKIMVKSYLEQQIEHFSYERLRQQVHHALARRLVDVATLAL